jgi:hypothetical protein
MAATQALNTGYHRPAIGARTRGLHFRSIPDPLRLQIDGIELKKENIDATHWRSWLECRKTYAGQGINPVS